MEDFSSSTSFYLTARREQPIGCVRRSLIPICFFSSSSFLLPLSFLIFTILFFFFFHSLLYFHSMEQKERKGLKGVEEKITHKRETETVGVRKESGCTFGHMKTQERVEQEKKERLALCAHQLLYNRNDHPGIYKLDMI